MMRFWVALAFAAMCAGQAPAQTLDKVTFGTNWVAEAEHGGFYQAVADGTYAKYGLDVTIVPGGPQVNNRILLPVGKLDFFMSANSLQAFDAVEQNVPTLAVAAMFQKDPQVLMAHPDQGIDKFADLKRAYPLFSKEGDRGYLPVAQGRPRLPRGAGAGPTPSIRSRSSPTSAGHAGLRHLRALRAREIRRIQAEDLPARRLRASTPIRP